MQNTKYSWVSFYEELADKLLAFKSNRLELIGKIKEAHQLSGIKLPTIEQDNNNVPDIDPFTVFALFNRGKQSVASRQKICEGYKQIFNINSDIPSDFEGVPMYTYNQYCFYRYAGDPKRDDSCFDTLWNLFEQALLYSKNHSNRTNLEVAFEQGIKLPLVGQPKMTMGLFDIRPNIYVNLDSVNIPLIEQELHVNVGLLSGAEYLDLCFSVLEYTKSHLNGSLPDFSGKAYELKQQTTTKTNDWEPSLEQYDPKLTKEDWLKFMRESEKFSENYKFLLAAMYDIGGQATCMQLEKKYGKSAASFNLTATHFAEHVQEFTKCPKRIDEEGKERYWSIPFVGRNTTDKEEGSFVWKLRPELKEAIEEYGLTTYLKKTKETNTDEKKEITTMISKNTILYGPPGTGKTYSSVIYAVAIIEGKKVEEVSAEPYSNIINRYNDYEKLGQIKFTTFHQSYGYEEFIEGIRPYTDSDTSELHYRIEPGLFLEFCDDDLKEAKSIDAFELSWQKLEKEAYEKGKEYQFTRAKTGSKFTGVLVEDAFRVVWKTGTFNTLAKSTIRDQWEKKINRDELSGGNIWAFDARQAIIDEMQAKYDLPECEQNLQSKGESKNKVFIIDEINRGNISKIFGELITLIEDTKREQTSVILPYSKKSFTVPKNVYILGTMNTADRSIATLDTALRRRFHFKEMQPKPELLTDIEVNGLNIGKMLDRMNNKIAILYDREHTIGHAYFMSLKKDPSIENLANIFADNIIPLLQEYFYDDYEKIRLVLGDNQKNDDNLQFIIAHANDYASLFGDSNVDYDESITYEINSKAFKNIDSYKSI